MSKVVIKRLSSSDLLWFKDRYLHASNDKIDKKTGRPIVTASGTIERRTRQKAIAINWDFIRAEYPQLGTRLKDGVKSYPLDVKILGPSPFHSTIVDQRPLNHSAKNWRLTGSTIDSPTGESGRFLALQEGDIAILEFTGSPTPTNVTLVLVSQEDQADRDAYEFLRNLAGETTRAHMVRTSRGQLTNAAAEWGLARNHPISIFLADDSEDEVEAFWEAENPSTAFVPYRKRKRQPRSKPDAAAIAQRNQDTGDSGEAWFEQFLKMQLGAGLIRSYEWTSGEVDAMAPYDFEVELLDQTVVVVDVKSTTGDFDKEFYLSSPELAEAAFGDRPYLIARISKLDDEDPALVLSDPIHGAVAPFADQIADLLGHHQGFALSSLRLHPSVLKWGKATIPTSL